MTDEITPAVAEQQKVSIQVDSESASNLGFKDPNKVFPKYLKEPDTSRLARSQKLEETIVVLKEASEDKGVDRANVKGQWDQSPTPYNAKYPYNHVFETESGHVLEFDDTEDNERIHLYHRTGTFQEVDKNGTEVRKIVGDKYEIWERNGYVHIKGECNITVEGNANIYVKNNCEFEVAGDLNACVGGDYNLAIGGNFNIETGGSVKVKTGGVEHHNNGGDFAVDAPAIWLNSGVASAGPVPGPYNTAYGPTNYIVDPLQTYKSEELYKFDDLEMTPAQSEKNMQVLAAAGVITPAAANSPVPAATPTVPGTIVPANTPSVPGAAVTPLGVPPGDLNRNTYLSPNVRLGQLLTNGRTLPASYGGLTNVQIADNMKVLAVNVIEPVLAKYPNMIITSGWRPYSDNADSQHPKGQAVDMQFPGKTSAEVAAIAKEIATTLPNDQVLLEYKNTNGGPPYSAWIHVAYSANNSNGKKPNYTFYNDARAPGTVAGEFKPLP